MIRDPGAGIALPEPREFFGFSDVPLAAVFAGVGRSVVFRDVVEGHVMLLENFIRRWWISESAVEPLPSVAWPSGRIYWGWTRDELHGLHFANRPSATQTCRWVLPCGHLLDISLSAY